MSHGLIVLVLSLLLGLQPITTDLYLPALPMLAADLLAAIERERERRLASGRSAQAAKWICSAISSSAIALRHDADPANAFMVEMIENKFSMRHLGDFSDAERAACLA